MTQNEKLVPVKPNGNYGVDAPFVPWMWVGFAVFYAALAYILPVLLSAPLWLAVAAAVAALGFLLGAFVYWYATFRGKFVVWDRILGDLPDASIKRVLDMGCGHGAVSIQSALRFPAAAIDGIDLWRSVDQSGNSPDAANHNAQLNGVDERISFATGDMVKLPYAKARFDLVTASMSIHNIRDVEGRAKAVSEAWRVLAPGGHIIIVDIQRAAEYVQVLHNLGAEQIQRRAIGWRMWWSGPWMATTMVRAHKRDR